MGSSGWNKPSANQPTVKKGGAKAPNFGKGILAGLVVCVLALGVLYVMRDVEKPAAKKAEKKPTKIAEVKPAVAPKVVEEPKEHQPVVEIKTNESGRIMRYEDGKPRWLYWRKPPSRYGTVTMNLDDNNSRQLEDVAMKGMPATDLFLAYLYNARPGAEFGDAISLKDFANRFIESLKTPIIVSKDDPERVKEIKRGVIELRLELKDRYDAGEDIEAVVKQTRKALMEDYLYRDQLRKEIENYAEKDDVSKEDVQDMVTAANTMLSGKGLTNFKMPKAILKRIERREKERLEKIQQEKEGANQ